MRFEFELIRLWQRPVAALLSGGVGTLPLAPLAEMPAGLSLDEALSPVIERMVERIQTEAPPQEVASLLTAAFVLTGLRVDKQQVIRLFQGVRLMRDSSAYQAILEEGAERGQIEEARKLLL